ncbi:MAG: Ig-like domain-containing protein [Bacteroidales bacterium]|jgi:hypothetical protein|nr:Ig-like domain-containing protein [Bacteroidales bacterium]
MKKLFLFSILCTGIFVFSCKKEKADIPVTGISLDQNTLELVVGVNDSATLIATVTPANADYSKIEWSSDNPEIAKVKEGVVTGLTEGTATITVTSADGLIKAICTVKVKVRDFTYGAKKFIAENKAKGKHTFNFNTSELPKTFTLRNGVKITIPAGINFTKSSQPVSGPLTLEAYGMLKPSDIILSGTSTNYIRYQDKGYLKSDGFVFIDVKQNGESVDEYIGLNNAINISIPTDEDDGTATMIWVGEEIADTALVWGDVNEDIFFNRGNDKFNWNEIGAVNGSFAFNFGSLGWVNCDVLWRTGVSFATVTVTVTGKTGTWASYQGYTGDTFVFFVGKGANVIAQLYTQINATTVQSYYNSMPVGDEGKMIAFSVKEGEFSFASQDVTIAADQQVTLNLKSIDKEALLDAIKALDQQ